MELLLGILTHRRAVGTSTSLREFPLSPTPDDGICNPVERGARRFGKSKDHRDDLLQVVIAMAIAHHEVPVLWWTFPGSESGERIIRTAHGCNP